MRLRAASAASCPERHGADEEIRDAEETSYLINISRHDESDRAAERDDTHTETDVCLDMEHLLLLLLLWSSGRTLYNTEFSQTQLYTCRTVSMVSTV